MIFLRRFIPNLAEHLRELTNMLKKYSDVEWSEDARKYFHSVKFSLTTAPILISPDYTSDFIIFSFSSEHTMAVVLMQKRDKTKLPIAFLSRNIRYASLRYNIIEKNTLALVKALKYFRVYILHSHTLTYDIPNAVVKEVLMQTNPKCRRGKWIANLLEYDLEIKSTNMIKGQGLAKLMADSNFHALDINLISALSENEEEVNLIQVFDIFLSSP